MKRKPAFSLVELLVVIAVIAVLAALLLPVLSRAKARAKRSVCLNNLRQVNLGLRMYSDDSRDQAPKTSHTTNSTDLMDWTGYKKLMKSYVGLNGEASPRDTLFACPADTFFYDLHRNGRGYVPESFHDQAASDYSSYGFNGGSPTVFGTNSPGIAGRTLSSIKHPARTVLVAEFSALCPWSWHQPREPRAQPPWLFNGAKNVVSFVDGHASYVKIYWNDTPYSNGALSLALEYDPPAGYDYQWSGD